VLLNTTAAGAGTASFSAPQSSYLPAAYNPQSQFVTTSDINDDGKIDLLIVDTNGNIGVLLNTTAAGATTASFATLATYATGAAPNSVAAADLNGDGKPDLIVANRGSNYLSILRNTTAKGSTSASFAAQQTFSTGSAPFSVAAADLNGDGKPDLVVSNVGDGNVSVLLNTTTSGATTFGFTGQQTFATGMAPYSVAIADLDGDGRADIATANNYVNSVSVLFNMTTSGATTASFTPQQAFATGSNPMALAIGDLNADGRADIAVANYGGSTVSVLMNLAAPGVVAEFPGAGVWQYSPAGGTWVQLTAADAASLASNAAGSIVGDFKGAGVWLYSATSRAWTQMTAADATNLGIDTAGEVVGQFGSSGVWLYKSGSGWRQLSAANSTRLAMDASGNVVGEFQGAGVWLYTSAAGWKQLTPADASQLSMAGGGVVGEFQGAGVWRYASGTGWQQLTPADATSVAVDSSGRVAAAFGSSGLYLYTSADGWQLLSASAARGLALDGLGDLVADFPGAGMWSYGPGTGWKQITGADATLFGISG
jgi:hypothetical protein